MSSMITRLAAGGALAATTALVATMPAPAGQPATNGTDTLQLEAAVRPAVTGSRARPRPVALELALRYTSVSGAPTTQYRTAGFQLPSGMDVNLEPKPTCRYSALLSHGVRGCPERTQVGSGTAILDGRPAGLGYPLPAKVRVFSALVDVSFGNPPRRPGSRPKPRLIIYAFAPGADVFVPVVPAHMPHFRGLGITNDKTSMPLGITIEELRMTLRHMRWPKTEGGKPLVQAPTTCTGSWRFAADYTFARFGPHLVASDDVPCRRAG
jgi:hypothetical protein